MSKKYSVWVGGVEINDRYLTATEASLAAWAYTRAGYDDVAIAEMEFN